MGTYRALFCAAMGRLEGKVAFVTSASRGIGHAVTLAFVREGCAVIACDTKKELLAKLKAECPQMITTVHMKDPLDCDRIAGFAAELDHLDILVNTASVMSENTAENCTEEIWDKSFDVNVKSIFLTTQLLLPLLVEAEGSIINFSSVASSVAGVASRCAYSASKAALIGLTKSIATDYIQAVRCNAVCLGAIEAPDLSDRIAKLGGDPAEVRRMFYSQSPMGRLGTMDEVASLCIYLGSDESRYMTGQVQVLDGGAGLSVV